MAGNFSGLFDCDPNIQPPGWPSGAGVGPGSGSLSVCPVFVLFSGLFLGYPSCINKEVLLRPSIRNADPAGPHLIHMH